MSVCDDSDWLDDADDLTEVEWAAIDQPEPYEPSPYDGTHSEA